MDYLARLQLVSKHKNKDQLIKHLYEAVGKRRKKPNEQNPHPLFQVIYRRPTWQLLQLALICAPHCKKNISRLKKDFQAWKFRGLKNMGHEKTLKDLDMLKSERDE